MKRIYKQVSWHANDSGFEVQLDGRQLKSPAKQALTLPTEALAKQIADEWDAVEETVEPAAMPYFSLAVTIIDRVSPQRAELISQMVSYGMNDLLCYREATDMVLASRQTENWDSWLDWAHSE